MRILLAVDGTPASEAAVDVVTERPWPPGATFRILSVAQTVFPPAAPILPEAPLEPERLTRRLEQDADGVARAVAEALRARGLEAQPVTRTGDPGPEIVDEAASWGAELVVVGSHGRTALSRFLLGSVADHVVRHAPCSVQVARRHPPR